MERTAVHAGETAATKSATTKSSAAPSVSIGEEGGKANKSREKKYEAKLENSLHDTRLPNLRSD
jgi:hypothetical protein